MFRAVLCPHTVQAPRTLADNSACRGITVRVRTVRRHCRDKYRRTSSDTQQQPPIARLFRRAVEALAHVSLVQALRRNMLVPEIVLYVRGKQHQIAPSRDHQGIGSRLPSNSAAPSRRMPCAEPVAARLLLVDACPEAIMSVRSVQATESNRHTKRNLLA